MGGIKSAVSMGYVVLYCNTSLFSWHWNLESDTIYKKEI